MRILISVLLMTLASKLSAQDFSFSSECQPITLTDTENAADRGTKSYASVELNLDPGLENFIFTPSMMIASEGTHDRLDGDIQFAPLPELPALDQIIFGAASATQNASCFDNAGFFSTTRCDVTVSAVAAAFPRGCYGEVTDLYRQAEQSIKNSPELIGLDGREQSAFELLSPGWTDSFQKDLAD